MSRYCKHGIDPMFCAAEECQPKAIEEAKARRSAAPCSASENTRSVMGSSEDMTWATPQEWFDYLNLEFKFTLDPCCMRETAKCERFFTPHDNGLVQSWEDERVYMNPPYGRDIKKWMRKAYNEAKDHGALVVAFVPARVDAQWWHNYAVKASEIRFPIGRVKNANGNAWPFPIAIVVFRPRVLEQNKLIIHSPEN